MKNALVILLAIGLVACDNVTVELDNEAPETEVEEVVEEEEVANDPLSDLRFQDDGTKWKSTPETHVRMDSIQWLIASHEDGTNFKELGADVHAVIKNIIKNCAMEGEDHNQYHIILHAMLQESKSMKKGGVEHSERLSRYVDAYYSHFELVEGV